MYANTIADCAVDFGCARSYAHRAAAFVRMASVTGYRSEAIVDVTNVSIAHFDTASYVFALSHARQLMSHCAMNRGFISTGVSHAIEPQLAISVTDSSFVDVQSWPSGRSMAFDARDVSGIR